MYRLSMQHLRLTRPLGVYNDSLAGGRVFSEAKFLLSQNQVGAA